MLHWKFIVVNIGIIVEMHHYQSLEKVKYMVNQCFKYEFTVSEGARIRLKVLWNSGCFDILQNYRPRQKIFGIRLDNTHAEIVLYLSTCSKIVCVVLHLSRPLVYGFTSVCLFHYELWFSGRSREEFEN